MWVRRSAIRPVPSYAKVHEGAVGRVQSELLLESVDSQADLDEAFENFELTQPALADHVGVVLSRNLGDSALALGYYLSLAIWMIFDRAQGGALGEVDPAELRSTKELYELDLSLREAEPTEPLETDDVVSMEQPALVSFVHDHIQTTLDSEHSTLQPEELRMIYSMLLIEILALSYAVKVPEGFPVERTEALA